MCGSAGTALYLVSYAIVLAITPPDDWRYVGFVAVGAIGAYIFFGEVVGRAIWEFYFKPAIDKRRGETAMSSRVDR